MALPRVVLIGDSIRMGYSATVRSELQGEAEIREPEDNGGTSENVLLHLDDWVVAQSPDLVHVNCGLHDIARPFDASGNRIPFDRYEQNVRTILQRARTETDAVVIWALTTPVNEKRHHENKPFDRFEADVVECNQIARRVARELHVAVDDLYQVVMNAGRDRLLGIDGVHFVDDGCELLGRAVADCIRAHLSSRG